MASMPCVAGRSAILSPRRCCRPACDDSRGRRNAAHQRGNNNAYCQDNEISGSTGHPSARQELRQFIAKLIALRASRRCCASRFFEGRPGPARQAPGLAWFVRTERNDRRRLVCHDRDNAGRVFDGRAFTTRTAWRKRHDETYLLICTPERRGRRHAAGSDVAAAYEIVSIRGKRMAAHGPTVWRCRRGGRVAAHSLLLLKHAGRGGLWMRVLVLWPPGWSTSCCGARGRAQPAGVRPQDAARQLLPVRAGLGRRLPRAAERDRRIDAARLHGDGTDGRWGRRITRAAFRRQRERVYLALRAAHENGVRHGVYTSSMSVLRYTRTDGGYPDEDAAPTRPISTGRPSAR